MKIITLVENTSANESFIAEHGLSIYIETEKHKLLLDTGQTDAAVRNAETLGIDLIRKMGRQTHAERNTVFLARRVLREA